MDKTNTILKCWVKSAKFAAIWTYFEDIILFLKLVNAAQPVDELKEAAINENGITAEDFHAYLVYCSGKHHWLRRNNIRIQS